jgi:Hypothetical glycosyl hydrolase family 15
MRSIRWAAAAAIIIAMAAPATARAASVAGHVRVAIASAAHAADFSQDPARDQYVILNGTERAKMLAIKAANPAVKVLLYVNLSAIGVPDGSGNVNTGVTSQEADPSWYLLNTGGQRFTFWGYDWMFAADIGNPAYQQRWADNVLAKLRSGGWDGVFMDDTNPTIKYHYDPAAVAKYPNDAAYSAATKSALAKIGPQIRAAGKLVIPNFGAWREYASTVNGWLQYVDGGMEEMLGKWSDDAGQGYLTGVDWQLQLNAIKAAQSAGKAYLGVTHGSGTDRQAALYGWGTVLLAAQGTASYTLADDYATQHWFPEFDYDLGSPAGGETADATGVHRRAFARGLVLVNPTLSTVAVGFGGAYSGSGLSHATQSTMPPHSALVLTADGAATPTPAPVSTPTPVATPTPPPAATPTPTPKPAATPTPRRRHPRTTRVAARASAVGSVRAVTAKVRCPKAGVACRRTVRVLEAVPGHAAVLTGKRTVKVPAGRSVRVSVPLNALGRRVLAHRGSLLVRVSG